MSVINDTILERLNYGGSLGRYFFLVILSYWLVSSVCATNVTIADFGAVGDGVTDNLGAFTRAFDSGATVVRVPSGRFAVSNLLIPVGVTIQGESHASTLMPTEQGQGILVALSDDTAILDLNFIGGGMRRQCLAAVKSKNIRIERIGVQNFDGIAIQLDHVKGALLKDCPISKVRRAVDILFSSEVRVLYNTVSNCSEHGIQFWGNWKWQRQECSDLLFMGNHVTNGGRGAIWGSGGKRVIISQNTVVGAEDCGLDLEWSSDSVISGNSVQGAKNGGIALFFACERVTISGNVISFNPTAPGKDKGTARWKPSAIWLTDPNRAVFKEDFGHREIAITGNSINCSVPDRGGIWVGAESDNVTLFGNAVQGGGVWSGRGGSEPVDLTENTTGTTIRSRRDRDK